jgi:hypothetical protein
VCAEGRLQSLDGAILIATACASTDANRTDQLTLNHDRKASRIREQIV